MNPNGSIGMTDNGIYRIRKAGMSYAGHGPNRPEVRLELERPDNLFVNVFLSIDAADQLMGLLFAGKVVEGYVHEMLDGMFVHVRFDNQQRVREIGDAFGLSALKIG